MASADVNAWGQTLGEAVAGWTRRDPPPRANLSGRYVRLEPLDLAIHSDDLLRTFSETEDKSWTYLPYGPFEGERQFRQWLDVAASGGDIFFAACDQTTDQAMGLLALMRIDLMNGSIEVGNIHFSDRLKRTRAATEAVFLLMSAVFGQWGYRRFEWKCNDLNEPSKKAAQRFGFRYEGLFRQAVVVKGRNRDTAWFSIIDKEWPALEQAYHAWLDPANFDAADVQRRSLTEFIAAARAG